MSETASTRSSAIEIRSLTFADLPAAMAIERRSFGSPWSLAMFLSELTSPDAVCLATDGPERGLAGYLLCTRYDQVWHLNNIAVDPARRCRGLGSQMVVRLLEVLGERAPLTLEVRPSNRAALAVYAHFGFRSVGRRRRYYPDNAEDALIMWRNEPGKGGLTRG